MRPRPHHVPAVVRFAPYVLWALLMFLAMAVNFESVPEHIDTRWESFVYALGSRAGVAAVIVLLHTGAYAVFAALSGRLRRVPYEATRISAVVASVAVVVALL